MPPTSRTRPQRAVVIEQLRARVARATLVVALEHQDVDGPTFTAIRLALPDPGWALVVTRERLARIALTGGPAAAVLDLLEGPGRAGRALLVVDHRPRDALRALVRAVAGLDRPPAEAWARFDPVAWARTVSALAGNHPRKPRPGAQVAIRGGLWGGARWSAEELLAEGTLDREVLYAQLLGAILGPAQRLVAVLDVVQRR